MGIKTPINTAPFSSDFARKLKKSLNPSRHCTTPIHRRSPQLKAWRRTRTPLRRFPTSRSSRWCTVASRRRQPSPEEPHHRRELQPPPPETTAALGENHCELLSVFSKSPKKVVHHSLRTRTSPEFQPVPHSAMVPSCQPTRPAAVTIQ
jgi:hypothetical protein